MNWALVESNWRQFKGTVRARWGKLTDEDLELIAGKREQLLGKIQELYGINRTEAQRELKVFEERNQAYRPKKIA